MKEDQGVLVALVWFGRQSDVVVLFVYLYIILCRFQKTIRKQSFSFPIYFGDNNDGKNCETNSGYKLLVLIPSCRFFSLLRNFNPYLEHSKRLSLLSLAVDSSDHGSINGSLFYCRH